MTRRKLILDVDTGTDDAVAIMLAALHPALDLVGVTTVNGNLPVEHCTDNTLRVLDHIGRGDVPVFEGLARPLVRPDPVPRGENVNHPRTLDLPPARSRKRSARAVEWLIETYRAATEPITLVPTAPLGNIAAALALDPGFAARVPEVVLMGGAHAHGNMTPSAEFNIWADPDAAARVFAAGFRRLVCVPLDATHQALVSQELCDRLRASGTPAGTATARLIGHRIAAHEENQPMAEPDAAPVHDALCVAFLADPAVIRTEFVHGAVETQGALPTGRTVVDRPGRGGGAPNCHFAFGADRNLFCAILEQTLGRA